EEYRRDAGCFTHLFRETQHVVRRLRGDREVLRHVHSDPDAVSGSRSLSPCHLVDLVSTPADLEGNDTQGRDPRKFCSHRLWPDGVAATRIGLEGTIGDAAEPLPERHS